MLNCKKKDKYKRKYCGSSQKERNIYWEKKIIIANIFLQDMTSSQNSDPVSPNTATLMVALDKLTLQMNQMQQHNQQQFEKLQKSNEDVSVRLEGVERRRRHDDSEHSSHNDEAEHVVRPQRGQRREVFGHHMLRRDNDEEEHGFRPRQGQRLEEFGNHTPRRDKMWMKIIIPKFNGANDLEAYLAWEMKLDQIFNSYDYEDDDKVLMASLEFEGYAMNWWNQITVDIVRRRRLPISTWEQLKVVMKERFVPLYYNKRDLQQITKTYTGK